MSKRLFSHSEKAQPLALMIVGISFLIIGALRYPAFLAVGVVFMIVGLRGLRYQRRLTLEGRTEQKD